MEIAVQPSNEKQNDNININKTIRLNVGLTIKKYWNKFSQLNTTLKQLKNHGINTIYLNTKNPKILTSLHISKADVVHGGGPQNTTRVHI